MDFSDAELGQLSSLLAHIFFGLNGDNLLEGQWQYGDKDSTVKLFAGATDGGIVCQPSALGGELFLWAFGHADKPLPAGFQHWNTAQKLKMHGLTGCSRGRLTALLKSNVRRTFRRTLLDTMNAPR